MGPDLTRPARVRTPANCGEDRELNIQIRDFPQQSGATSSREEAEAAFRTIIRWAGDNPDRPGLLETPTRAARAFREYFAGYDQHPLSIPNKTFDEARGYEEMVVLRGISFQSHCERHCAHYRSGVGCLRSLWAGCGALEVCSRCRRICRAAPDPGRMTSEIASAVQEVLQRQGVGVVIKAIHHCLERGVQKVGAEMVTSCMHGCFRDSARRGKNSWL